MPIIIPFEDDYWNDKIDGPEEIDEDLAFEFELFNQLAEEDAKAYWREDNA